MERKTGLRSPAQPETKRPIYFLLGLNFIPGHFETGLKMIFTKKTAR
jgi:hypothetical protein